GERTLARVRGEEQRAPLLQKRRSPRAGMVAGERLDLDDVGSARGQQLRRRWPREGGRDIDDPSADEWPKLGHRGCSQTTCGPPSGSSIVSLGVAPTRFATSLARTFRGAMSEIRPAPPNQSRNAEAASVA